MQNQSLLESIVDTYDIDVGHYVFCYTGTWRHTIQRVTGFRSDGGIMFGKRDWLILRKLVSLTGLGIPDSKIEEVLAVSHYREVPDETGNGTYMEWYHPFPKCDIIANQIHPMDKVLYINPENEVIGIGTVKTMSANSCVLHIDEDPWGRTEYRKKYDELINLTAIGYE